MLSKHEFNKFQIEYGHVLNLPMFKDRNKEINPKALYHYTSLEVMYKILAQDEMWAGNIRFSNDLTEGLILPTDKHKTNDNYVICFSAERDLLSQWRGYCGNGGVSIEMMFKSESLPFRIIDTDFDKTGGCIEDFCCPFPVIYLDNKGGQPGELRKHLEVHNDIDLESFLPQIVPYLKNHRFFEEIEYRLIFSNNDYRLSRCIYYRDIGNGSKVPFIKIRPKGEYGTTERVPSVDAEFDKNLEEILKGFTERNGITRIIRIPFCANQQSIYEKLWTEVEAKNLTRKAGDDYIRVLCDGHFPITTITVAPMQNAERTKEQIEHFCRNKYWLRQVEVKISEIPYAASLLK